MFENLKNVFSSLLIVEECKKPMGSSELLAQMQNLISSLSCSNLNIPQLVLTGSQSAGKTSLINKFAGIDLLPTSNTMTTRCAMQIILISNNNNNNNNNIINKEDDIFYINDGIAIKNLETFKYELNKKINILLLADKLIISNDLIKITFISSKVLGNLTFIDLPGLIQVCQHDPSLPSKIEDLVSKYIKDPNSIILACIPARLDVEVDVVLRLLEKNQTLNQSLGALLKIDLLNTNDQLLLQKRIDQNKLFPIGYGYELVETNPINLFTKINNLLKHNVQKQLPTLKMEVEKELELFKNETNIVSSIDIYLQSFIIDEINKLHDSIDHGILGTSIGFNLELLRKNIMKFHLNNNEMENKNNNNKGYHLDQPIISKPIATVEQNLPLYFNISKLINESIDFIIDLIVHFNDPQLDEISNLFRTSLFGIMTNIKEKEIMTFIHELIEIEQSFFWSEDINVLKELNSSPENLSSVYISSIHKTIFCDLIPKLIFCKIIKPIINKSWNQILIKALSCQPAQCAFLQRNKKKSSLLQLLETIQLYSQYK